MALVEFEQAQGAAGDPYGQRSLQGALGHNIAYRVQVQVRAKALRGRLAKIQGPGIPVVRHPQAKASAPQIARLGIDHRKGQGCGYRSVRGIATLIEDRQTHRNRQGVLGYHRTAVGGSATDPLGEGIGRSASEQQQGAGKSAPQGKRAQAEVPRVEVHCHHRWLRP